MKLYLGRIFTLRLVLALIVVPALAYPLFTTFLLAVDTFFGDAEALHQFRSESAMALARLLAADWLAALPVLYGVLGLAIVLAQVARACDPHQRSWPTLAASSFLATAIAVGGSVALGATPGAFAAAMALAGALLGGFLVLLLGRHSKQCSFR